MNSAHRSTTRPTSPIAGLLAMLLLGACSLPSLATWHATPPDSAGRSEIGRASWYGPGFHGNPTSSGEIYNQYAMTAAHQTLPLGSRVMVTNLENDKSVELRINDRGPFVDGRIIDLSYSAARTLELVGPGTASVKVDRLDDGADAGSRVLYAAQAAAFQDGSRAFALKDSLERQFPVVYLAPVSTPTSLYYRVRVGPFEERGQALAQARRLDRLGYRAVVVEEVAR